MSNNAHFSHAAFQLSKRRTMDSPLANLTLETYRRKLSQHFIWLSAASTKAALFFSRAVPTVYSSMGVWLRGRQIALFTYY
jgi:hypothetical protein